VLYVGLTGTRQKSAATHALSTHQAETRGS
jgi:hypothetical protein